MENQRISQPLYIASFVLYGSLFFITLFGLARLIRSSSRRYWQLERDLTGRSALDSTGGPNSSNNNNNNNNNNNSGFGGSVALGGGAGVGGNNNAANNFNAPPSPVRDGTRTQERVELLSKRARGTDNYRTQRIFHYFLLVFLIFRVAWFVVGMLDTSASESPDLLEFSLNRCAVCAFFSGFTLVFFYWVESFHSLFFDSDSTEFLPGLRVVFVVVNVLLYLFQATVIGVYLYRHVAWRLEPLVHDELYVASIMVVGASDLLVSLGFLMYGLRMFFVNKQLTDDLSPANRRQRVVTLLATLIFCACFILRFVMFIWVPSGQGNEKVSNDIVMVLAYIVPEIIPSLLQLAIVQSKHNKTERDERFISKLYAEYDEARRFEAEVETTKFDTTPYGSYAQLPRIVKL